MTLEDYARLVREKCCVGCKRPFTLPIKIEHYPHSDGWLVNGFEDRQWLYVTCKHCDYQSALWKIGIAGSANIVQDGIAQKRAVVGSIFSLN